MCFVEMFWEVTGNVIGHGNIEAAGVVFPIKSQAAVQHFGPVNGEIVMGLDA